MYGPATCPSTKEGTTDGGASDSEVDDDSDDVDSFDGQCHSTSSPVQSWNDPISLILPSPPPSLSSLPNCGEGGEGRRDHPVDRLGLEIAPLPLIVASQRPPSSMRRRLDFCILTSNFFLLFFAIFLSTLWRSLSTILLLEISRDDYISRKGGKLFWDWLGWVRSSPTPGCDISNIDTVLPLWRNRLYYIS